MKFTSFFLASLTLCGFPAFCLADGQSDQVRDLSASLKKLEEESIYRNSGKIDIVLLQLQKLGPDAQPTIPLILPVLNSDVPDNLEVDACKVLASMGLRAKEAIPALRARLADPKKPPRQALRTGIENIFQQIGPDAAQAVPDLLRNLNEPQAVLALGGIGPAATEAIPSLQKQLDVQEPVLAASTALALSQISPNSPDAPSLRKRAINMAANFISENDPRSRVDIHPLVMAIGLDLVPDLGKCLAGPNIGKWHAPLIWLCALNNPGAYFSDEEFHQRAQDRLRMRPWEDPQRLRSLDPKVLADLRALTPKLIPLVSGEHNRDEYAIEFLAVISPDDPKVADAIVQRISRDHGYSLSSQEVTAAALMRDLTLPGIRNLAANATPGPRNLAADALAWIDPQSVPGIGKPFASLDYNEQRELARQLTLAGPDAIPQIVQALAVQDPNFQQAFYRVLAQYPRIALPELIKALKSPDISLRLGAAQGLAHVNDPAGIPPLIDAVLAVRDAKDIHLREFQDALAGLFAAFPKEAIQRFDHGDEYIRWLALTSVQYVQSDPEISAAAFNHLSDSSQRVREATRQLFFQQQKVGLDLLVSKLQSTDAAVRAIALDVLSQFNQPVARDAIAAAVKDPSPKVRAAAIHALCAYSNVPPWPPHVIVDAINDPDPQVRAMALSAVMVKSNDEARKRAADLLSDPDPQVRRNAVNVLSEYYGMDRTKPVEPRLVALLRDPDPQIRDLVLNTIKRSDITAAVGALADLTQDPGRRTRLLALSALADARAANALPALRKSMSDPDALIRDAAISAVCAISPMDSQDILAVSRGALSDSDDQVRLDASMALARGMKERPSVSTMLALKTAMASKDRDEQLAGAVALMFVPGLSSQSTSVLLADDVTLDPKKMSALVSAFRFSDVMVLDAAGSLTPSGLAVFAAAIDQKNIIHPPLLLAICETHRFPQSLRDRLAQILAAPGSDPLQRQWAAIFLSQVGQNHDANLDLLLQALKGDQSFMRLSALHVISFLNRPSDSATADALFQAMTDPIRSVRQAAISAGSSLSLFGDGRVFNITPEQSQQNAQYLRDLQSDDPQKKIAAAGWAADTGIVAFSLNPALRELVQYDPDASVRNAAVDALRKLYQSFGVAVPGSRKP